MVQILDAHEAGQEYFWNGLFVGSLVVLLQQFWILQLHSKQTGTIAPTQFRKQQPQQPSGQNLAHNVRRKSMPWTSNVVQVPLCARAWDTSAQGSVN